MTARLIYWASEAALLFAAWLLFVDQLAPHELLAGALAAVIAATAAEAVRREQQPRFLPHLRWLVACWRLPARILYDCGLLLRNLFDRRTGRFERIPFEAGGNDAHSVARRALAIFTTTLPPNTLVIGIDRQRNYILVHRLEGSS